MTASQFDILGRKVNSDSGYAATAAQHRIIHLACSLMIAALVTLLSVDSFNNSQGSMGWDVNQQQWVPIPPPPQSIKVRMVLISLAADAVLAVLPIIWLRRFVKRNRSFSRMSRGRCPSCGYDLRHTSQRCSECGSLAQFETTTPGITGIKAYLILLPIILGAFLLVCAIVTIFILWVGPRVV